MDEKRLKLAYLVAAQSPDPSNQNGAVVVNSKGEVYGVGFNGFGKVKVTDEMLNDRDTKLAYIEHAERAALFEAARYGATEGSTLYCPWVACSDCARAIARLGVKRVVCHKPRMDLTPERWIASVQRGLGIMKDYKVAIDVYENDLEMNDGFYILVNGEPWRPGK